jgi:hypothetical protein
MSLTRRQALSAIPAAIAGTTANAGTTKRRDDWSPKEKKTRRTLASEARMMRALDDALLVLNAVARAHGRCGDCEVWSDAWSLAHHLGADVALLDGQLIGGSLRLFRAASALSVRQANSRLLPALGDAISSIDDMHEEHGMTCDCGFCWDAYHCRWLLANFEGQFACILPRCKC